MVTRPRGRYHGRGWVVEVGDDAEADAVLVAEIHEAMHDRLQMTTAYGLLIDHLTTLPAGGGSETALMLQRGSTRVHEEFATWMSCIPAQWNMRRLAETFPLYAGHLRRAIARVATLADPYLAMHAIQGAARACLQSPDAALVLAREDIAGFSSAELGRHHRPDWRLTRLDEALRREGWGPLRQVPDAGRSLDLRAFADDNDHEWAHLSKAAYAWCASLLAARGCPTLPYDDHLPFVPASPSGHTDSGDPLRATDSARVALLSVESQTLALGEPLPAVIHPADTALTDLIAGGGGLRHLFVAIRPRENVLSQYAIRSGKVPSGSHLALVRCQDDDGIVELREVTPSDLSELPASVPVVVSASMTSLSRGDIADRWGPLLRPGRATVLIDQRPSINLPGWLEPPDLRYAVFGVETHVGWVRVLCFRIENDAGTRSRTYLSPVPRLYSSGLRLMLDESPILASRAIEDSALADEPDVRVSVAHILLEERLFHFKAGDPWSTS